MLSRPLNQNLRGRNDEDIFFMVPIHIDRLLVYAHMSLCALIVLVVQYNLSFLEGGGDGEFL